MFCRDDINRNVFRLPVKLCHWPIHLNVAQVNKFINAIDGYSKQRVMTSVLVLHRACMAAVSV